MSEGTIRALLIEDNPIHARLIQRFLDRVDEPTVVWEAVDRLSTGLSRLGAGNIDLVLLDLILPDCQEIETFLRLKEAAPAVPVVILTGLDDLGLADRAVSLGAREYLVKTQIDEETLARAVRSALSGEE